MPELKQAFHELIARIDDEDYLQELYEGVAALHQRPVLDDKAVVAKLRTSLETAQPGQGVPHDEFMSGMKTWLSK